MITEEKGLKKIYLKSRKKAFAWAQKEMATVDNSLYHFLDNLSYTNHRSGNRSNMAFFYDEENDTAYCRIESANGEIVYDTVENYNTLRFMQKEFVEEMIENGILISTYYEKKNQKKAKIIEFISDK